MASLVDTNILIYRWDPRDSHKQAIAEDLLRNNVSTDLFYIPHQAIVEFMAVAPRLRWMEQPVLTIDEIRREAEELMVQFQILYPNEALLRLAFRGMATYHLPWFDAHLWAYAEHYGLSEILSEDFGHGQRFGTVRVRNPFLDANLA